MKPSQQQNFRLYMVKPLQQQYYWPCVMKPLLHMNYWLSVKWMTHYWPCAMKPLQHYWLCTVKQPSGSFTDPACSEVTPVAALLNLSSEAMSEALVMTNSLLRIHPAEVLQTLCVVNPPKHYWPCLKWSHPSRSITDPLCSEMTPAAALLLPHTTGATMCFSSHPHWQHYSVTLCSEATSPWQHYWPCVPWIHPYFLCGEYILITINDTLCGKFSQATLLTLYEAIPAASLNLYVVKPP